MKKIISFSVIAFYSIIYLTCCIPVITAVEKTGKPTLVHIKARMVLVTNQSLEEIGIPLSDFNGVFVRTLPDNKSEFGFNLLGSQWGDGSPTLNEHVQGTPPSGVNSITFFVDPALNKFFKAVSAKYIILSGSEITVPSDKEDYIMKKKVETHFNSVLKEYKFQGLVVNNIEDLPGATQVNGTFTKVTFKKEALENPDAISRIVLEKGLDSETAFEIVSVDIADVDVGNNGVQINGKVGEWDVQPSLSGLGNDPGAMTVTVEEENFGTFDSNIPVTPKFTLLTASSYLKEIECKDLTDEYIAANKGKLIAAIRSFDSKGKKLVKKVDCIKKKLAEYYKKLEKSEKLHIESAADEITLAEESELDAVCDAALSDMLDAVHESTFLGSGGGEGETEAAYPHGPIGYIFTTNEKDIKGDFSDGQVGGSLGTDATRCQQIFEEREAAYLQALKDADLSAFNYRQACKRDNMMRANRLFHICIDNTKAVQTAEIKLKTPPYFCDDYWPEDKVPTVEQLLKTCLPPVIHTIPTFLDGNLWDQEILISPNNLGLPPTPSYRVRRRNSLKPLGTRKAHPLSRQGDSQWMI